MIWAMPRSKSTILSKSLSANGDNKCFLEPFFYTYFLSQDASFTYTNLRTILDQQFFGATENVMLKDMTVYLENLENWEKWIGDETIKHIILVRDPKEIALSTIVINGQKAPYMDSNHGSTIEEYAISLLKMKNFLEEKSRKFKVFNTTNLTKETSEQFVKSMCEFADIPFDKEKMLSMIAYENFPAHWWLPPPIKDPNWDEKNDNVLIDFFGKALQATEIGSGKSKITEDDLSDEKKRKLKDILEKTYPIYNEMLVESTYFDA